MTFQLTLGVSFHGRSVTSMPFVPLHGATSSTPIPHWVVLIIAVLGLWVGIAGGVLLIDGLSERISNGR